MSCSCISDQWNSWNWYYLSLRPSLESQKTATIMLIKFKDMITDILYRNIQGDEG